MDLGEGLAEGTVVDLVVEDMEEVEGSWPPRECPFHSDAGGRTGQ